ncbi:TPA: hypothetical protein ACH74B_004878 [Escherichia coli]
MAFLQAFGEQAQTISISPKNFDGVTPSATEDKQVSSGTFTLPARFCREILPDDVRSITIILEKSDDEWWYGSY